MIRLLVFFLILLPVQGVSQRASESSTAEIRWLDRTTGELQTFILSVGEPVTIGPIDVHLHSCRYPLDKISLDAFALLSVYWAKDKAQLFTGWMVASAPALNALEHPRYDVWVLRCKTL
jgi:hypothetical protein